MLVVTTEAIPGYEIRRVIGEVVGVTAKTVNAYVEKIRYLNGTSNPDFFGLLARTRQEAVKRMWESALLHGGNAVVGMRFDHRPVTAAWNEICAYGTAVVVECTHPVEAEETGRHHQIAA
jgi:uncharacterized protein YbjQ (UPF0145 family)